MRTSVQKSSSDQSARRVPAAAPTEEGLLLAQSHLAAARSGFDFSGIPVRSSTRAVVQPKLMVNTQGDSHEQEADQVADQVMRLGSSDKGASHKGINDEDEPTTKRPAAEKCSECAEDDKSPSMKAGPALGGASHATATGLKVDPEVEVGIQSMRGGGRPLSSSERQFMEPRFGADFGAVRLHTNQAADTYSRALQARAFTVGGDIFFRSGEHGASSSPAGRQLLAHELAHTIQQGAARPMVGRKSGPSPSSAAPSHTATHGVQRQPAPPVVAPVAAPASVAGINFLPTIFDQVPAGWGVTTEDDAVVDITAFADGAVWKCVVSSASQQARQGVRLLPGVKEVTPALVSGESNCATLQTMITSLDTVANQGTHSGFYMLSAVQAHENLHITQYRAALSPAFATFKTAVQALTVPFASHANAAAAKAAIKALPAFATARATFQAADVSANNVTAAHTNAASFNTVEHSIVDPMITTIKARRTTLKCPP
jgi:hypothetical protein